MTERDKKMALLIHDYKQAYDKAQPEGPLRTYPEARVLTVARTISSGNSVHTYDQIQSYIGKHDDIGVGTCYCRHEAELLGEELHGIPKEVCMCFGPATQFLIERLNGRKISREEAGEIFDLAEAHGLIHMSSNTSDDIRFMCNCDRYQCEAIKSALRREKPGQYFNSGFQPEFDADSCTACEECIDRCFGCAVCATVCPSEAITIIHKPGYSAPPKNDKELIQAIESGSNRLKMHNERVPLNLQRRYSHCRKIVLFAHEGEPWTTQVPSQGNNGQLQDMVFAMDITPS
jgi:Pyruvate/2-oxoacid:ferredoxin oxidoreductase delta subunit